MGHQFGLNYSSLDLVLPLFDREYSSDNGNHSLHVAKKSQTWRMRSFNSSSRCNHQQVLRRLAWSKWSVTGAFQMRSKRIALTGLLPIHRKMLPVSKMLWQQQILLHKRPLHASEQWFHSHQKMLNTANTMVALTNSLGSMFGRLSSLESTTCLYPPF